jgi:hypothetical protein
MRTVLALVLIAVALPARADDPAGPGLDLLLLVDRSGSMSSHSPAAIVDALPLALNTLAWSSRSARLNHRFGIVSFGSRAELEVPLTIVDGDALPLLRTRIGELPSHSLGHTNVLAPFEVAAEAFRSLPQDGRRRRAILLLTDGHIDVPGEREREIVRKLETLADAALAQPAVSVAVLLFGAQETVPWRGPARGRLHHVDGDRGNLLATLHRIVSGLVGARSVERELAGGSVVLVIPPYLELVVFDIVRGGSDREIAVLAPGATEPLTARSPGVEIVRTGDRLSTVIVRRPAAGAWIFRKSDPSASVTVLSQQFFPRGALIQPTAMPPVRQHDSVRIGYRLEDGDGKPLTEELGYPLSVDVSLALPDGQRVVLPMTRDPASRTALYRTLPAACDVAGRYWTEVLVSTADSSGQPVRIFEDRWSGFTVETDPLRPVRAALIPGVTQPDGRGRAFHPMALLLLAIPMLIVLLVFLWRR